MWRALIVAAMLSAAAPAQAGQMPIANEPAADAGPPVARAASKSTTICGPASYQRPECRPAKPVYRHHHGHCYWAAGVQRCT